jgi:ribosomal-protein-alanine N-acetyltransferase
MSITGSLRPIVAGSAEWDLVREFDQRYFPRPWPPEQWQLGQEHHLLGWFEDRELRGFCLLAHLPDDETSHLLKILVHPEHRGTGVAGSFWKAITLYLRELKLSKVYLEVEASNQGALRFYAKQGFRTLRSVKQYYSDGEGAHMMELTL